MTTNQPLPQASNPQREGTIARSAGLITDTATAEDCTKALRIVLNAQQPNHSKIDINNIEVMAGKAGSKLLLMRYTFLANAASKQQTPKDFNALTAPFRRSEQTYFDAEQHRNFITVIGETWLSASQLAEKLNEAAKQCGKLEEISAIQKTGHAIG